MAIDILMPALSPTMTEGKLAKWHVKEGDKVTSGKVICEIETDKATMEVEAVDEGTIGKILIAEGTENVAVNTPIAILLEEGEDAAALAGRPKAAPAGGAPEATPAAAPQPDATEPKPAPAARPAAAPQPAPAPAAPAPAPQAPSRGQRIFASPLARRIAEGGGVDLARVQGTGPNGRIVKSDVESAIKSGTAKPQAAPATKPAPTPARAPLPQMQLPSGENRHIPHTSIRKIIARRMLESKQLVPHFYLTVEYELDALLAARTAINAGGKVKISVNDMLIKACALALRDHPDVNASYAENEMIQYGTVDVSVAVATDRGLVTPIVRQADMKGLARISAEMKDLAARAKEGKLKLDEFQGGGFTISNLGMFNVKDFAAIINPPQAAILAVGAGEERVVVRDGKMVIRTMMNCTLSVDHRAVDGALGAVFLQTLRRYVEQPANMLL